MHQVSFLADPIIWYSVSLAVFLYIAVKFGRRPFLAFLDGEIAKVQSELEKAKKLREEAETAIAHYASMQEKAQLEVDRIISEAHDEAARVRHQAGIDLKHFLDTHEQRAKDRIRQAEAEAMNEIRAMAIDCALRAAQKTLENDLDSVTDEKIIESAIAEVPLLKASGSK